jgi:hypothetical protein
MVHRLLTLLLCAAACMSIAAAQPSARFALGVNLDDMGAFVNIVNHTSRYSNATGYDSLGWPTSDFDLVLMDGRPVAEWAGSIDDPDRYRIDYSGRYAGAFIGRATVRATGTSVTVENVAYDSTRNRTTFDLVVGGFPNANHGLVFLQIRDTRRTPASPPNTGITELRVHRPGYPIDDARIFTDAYLALCRAADFACYRFYNVQNIWDGEPVYPAVTRWQQRKTPRDAAQVSMASTSGKRDGWCWEYIVALANELRKDVWICVHQSCDSTYVTELADMLARDLDPAINIHVESSNEVWSPTQATHGPYNAAAAAARGISFDQNHARRTVELSRWFAGVFGAQEINRRIRVIMAGQHAYHGRSDTHLDYINRTFGAPDRYIWATSTALYFGSTRASSPDTTAILAGMMEDITAQRTDAQTATYRPVHVAKAAAWKLPGGCTSYEGGPHLPAGGGTTNLDAQIRAHRTLAMRDVLVANYTDAWRDLGGGLALHFTLASAYTRYGCWGLTDDVSHPDRNHKMDAMREIIRTATTAVDTLDVANGTRSQAHARGIEISAAPHPFTNVLTLRSTSALPIDVRITDLLGREVWRGALAGIRVIPTASWSAGLYLLTSDGRQMRIMKR